jgi:peroxiredoxin (alkyl hydroperoxide reductase subunit C)
MSKLLTKFPEMKVVTTHGEIELPNYYTSQGKGFILFSHPADFTPVCTTEFVEFQKRYEEFKKEGFELIGLSVDQVFSHIKWVDWIKEKLGVEIEFPIIADDTGEVAKALGMIPEGKTKTIRSVYIVDKNGIIHAVISYPYDIGRNIDEILRFVKALNTSQANGVATPANWGVKSIEWRENSLIGDKVIVPPAADINTAKQRLEAAERGEIECFDWWFCCKNLEK